MSPTPSFSRLASLLLLVFSLAVQGAPTARAEDTDCCSKDFIFTDEHRESMMLGYKAIWNGDFSNINNTLMNTLDVHMDRYSTGNGSIEQDISTPAEFVSLVQYSRSDWASTVLTPVKWVGNGNYVALHWNMTSVMSANYTKMQTTLKPGDTVMYEGNDFLTLDKCTGKISGIIIAQDFLDFFYKMGVKLLPL